MRESHRLSPPTLCLSFNLGQVWVAMRCHRWAYPKRGYRGAANQLLSGSDPGWLWTQAGTAAAAELPEATSPCRQGEQILPLDKTSVPSPFGLRPGRGCRMHPLGCSSDLLSFSPIPPTLPYHFVTSHRTTTRAAQSS